MKIRSVLPFLFALFLLGGCGSSTDSDPVAGAGKAHLSSPLIGATVEVRDALGQNLTLGKGGTGKTGTFALKLPAGVTRFRLVVTGGTYEGQPFQDTLLLDVEQFDPARDLLYVNAATTLISRYIDRHPGTNVADASAKVKGFLGIPASSKAGFSVDNPHQNYFRHELLLDAVRNSGGKRLNAYLDGLVSEIDAGVSSHAFSRARLGGAGSTIAKIVEELATHLGDEFFSWGFEAILTALGAGSNAEILNQLHEINAKLDELKEQVTKVDSDVLKGIEIGVATALQNATTNIQSQYEYLTWVAQYASIACLKDASGNKVDGACVDQLEATKQEVRKRKASILDGDVGIVQHFALISGTLSQIGTGPGLLSIARDYLKTTTPFDAPVVDPRLTALNEYYKTLQLMAVNLIVEAYMAGEDRDGKPLPDKALGGHYLTLLDAATKKQDALVATLRRENEHTVVDQRTNLIWLRGAITIPKPSINWWEESYIVKGTQICQNLADTKYAGYSKWRLPTDPELHQVVKESPNSSGNADGGTGIFNWLVAQGFIGFSVDTAYFSSTISGTSGHYYEALWDRGVDYACTYGNYYDCDFGATINMPARAAAWCVTADKSE